MAGDIVILYPAITLKEGFPIDFVSTSCETDDCRQMVKEHLAETFCIQHVFRHWRYFAQSEIVLQFLIMQTDFKSIKPLRVSIVVKDIRLVGVVFNLRFLVVCLNRNTVALVCYGFLLLDGDGRMVEAVQGG